VICKLGYLIGLIQKFDDIKQLMRIPLNPLVFCEDTIKGNLEMNCTNFYYFFSLNKGKDRRGILPILPKINGYWYKSVFDNDKIPPVI